VSAALDRSALDLRLRLGADALFSIDEAALLLPVPPELGRAWIEANVKQTRIAGVVSLRWADVLRAVEAAGTTDTSVDVSVDVLPSRWLSTQEAADLLGVNRKTLDGLARGNLDVAGGPVVVGGRKRIHLRWPTTGLETWLGAVRARATEPAKPAKRRAAPRRAQPDEDGPTDWGQVRRRLLGP
jgi:hypothetical protein